MSSVSIKGLSMCSHVNSFCFVSGLNNNNNNNLKMLLNPWCSLVGVLLYTCISYMGMCCTLGYGFWAVLVWNRVWFWQGTCSFFFLLFWHWPGTFRPLVSQSWEINGVQIFGVRSEKGSEKSYILVWNRVRVLRTVRHTPTQSFEEYPPSRVLTDPLAPPSPTVLTDPLIM